MPVTSAFGRDHDVTILGGVGGGSRQAWRWLEGRFLTEHDHSLHASRRPLDDDMVEAIEQTAQPRIQGLPFGLAERRCGLLQATDGKPVYLG